MLTFRQYLNIVFLQMLETFMDLHQQGEHAILQCNLHTGNWEQQGWAKEASTISERPIWGNLVFPLMLTLAV